MNDKPWLKSYPAAAAAAAGVRWDAPIDIASVPSVLEMAAQRFGALPALQFMDKRITYSELEGLANRAVAGLQKLGVGPGVRVGLYLPNTPHYVIAFFGMLKAGGVVVNYSPLDALGTLERKIEDSETVFLVTLDVASLYPQAEKLLASTRLKRLVVGEFAEYALAPGPVKAFMTSQGMLSDVRHDGRRIAFRDLLDNDGRYQPHDLGDPAEAVAVIAYTGGTTGSPKGAMLTHANLTVACSLYREVFTRSGPNSLREGEERFLCILPLLHIFSLSVVLMLGFRLGAELVLHPRFDPAAAARDIALKQITVYLGVRTMHVAILTLPDVEKMDFSSLRLCGSGGAPLPAAVKERFDSVVGCPLGEGWGMTETSPIGTFTPRDGPTKPGSCGIPYPGTQMKFIDVVDPEHEVAIGQRGEICVKGPNVMKGYWKQPEATAAAMTADGFFRTGDVGYMDEDGLRLYRRPHQGHAARRRLQRLSAQHRGGDLPASFGRGGERDRRSRRLPRRNAQGLRQAQGRGAAADARRSEGLPQEPARQAQDDQRVRDPRRAAEDGGRQDFQEGLARGRAR